MTVQEFLEEWEEKDELYTQLVSQKKFLLDDDSIPDALYRIRQIDKKLSEIDAEREKLKLMYLMPFHSIIEKSDKKG